MPLTCYRREEGLREVMHEVKICAVGTYLKVYGVVCWRHISVDKCLRVKSVICNSVDIYLSTFLYPCCFGIEGTHVTSLKLKVVNHDIRIHREISEWRNHSSAAGCSSAKLHTVEVYEVEDVCHFHFVKVHCYGVFSRCCCLSVDDKVLLTIIYAELVYV